MKKRLLALALCLVLATSLLPITAAADTPVTVNSVQITASGLKKDSLGGYPNVYQLDNPSWSCNLTNNDSIVDEQILSIIASNDIYSLDISKYNLITEDPIEGQPYYLYVFIRLDSNTFPDYGFDKNFSANSKLTLTGYETKLLDRELDEGDDYGKQCLIWLQFSLKKEHEHNWEFTVTKNNDTLTAECQNTDCGKEVSVSLKADSVTLPNSPFNAWLEGWDAFQAATGAEKTDIVYKCNGEPADKNNPKAGQYQAWVMIKNLPGPVWNGPVALADNQDSSGNTAELFVHYTAVDPAVTAQTGDNRPIEIMMGSVLVFSALAAAAFILDNKRKYSR